MSTGLTEQFPQAQNMADFPAAAHDLLGLDGLLNTEERCTRDAVRQFMVRASCSKVCPHTDAQLMSVRVPACCICYLPDGLAPSMQETEVAPIIADHWERASFPFEIIPKLRKLNLGASLGIRLPWQRFC